MGELARIRSARDLRVSRGHVVAALLATCLVALTAFALGASLGTAVPAPPARGFTAEVPGDDLVELLARIDASSLPGGGASALTYQDDLRGAAGSETAAPVQPVAPGSGEIVTVPAGEGVVPVVADPAPRGSYTVWVAESGEGEEVRGLRDALRRDGLPAWVAVRLVDGEPRYTLAVGGYTSKEDAHIAATTVAAATDRTAVVRELGGGAIGATVELDPVADATAGPSGEEQRPVLVEELR